MARAYTSLELDSPPCELVADLEDWSSESTERSRVPWSRLQPCDAPEATADAPVKGVEEQPQVLSKVQRMAQEGSTS